MRIGWIGLIVQVMFVMTVFPLAGRAGVIAFPGIELSSENSHTEGNDSDGFGTVTGVYNDVSNQLCFTMSWTLDTTSTLVSNAHFHGPATPLQDAGVQIGITGFSTARIGTHTQIVTPNETQEGQLLAGLWYLNIHSDQFGQGELRGQMVSIPSNASFADLPVDTTQEGIAPTGGIGTINAAYNKATKQLTFCLEWSGLSGPITLAHFHKAAAGSSGPPTITLHTLPNFPLAAAGTFAAFVTLNETQEADLLAGLWYVNLHTAAHGSGEIRGQLIPQIVSSVENWNQYEN
jgi:hypothetical protein